MMSNERFHWSLIWKTFDLGQTFEFGNETTRSEFWLYPPTNRPSFGSPKICRLLWEWTFKYFEMFLVFWKFLWNLRAGTRAQAQLSLAWTAGSPSLAQLLERGSARFYFHFVARADVQGTPDVRLLKPRHVFRRILPCRAFLVESADSAAMPHPGRRFPDRSLSPPCC